MISPKPKVIFFDLDGTLLDYEASAKQSIKTILTIKGIEGDIEVFYHEYHKINGDLWTLFEQKKAALDFILVDRFRILLEAWNLTNEELETISKEYLEILSQQGHMCPNAIDVLEYLKGKYPLSIITNGVHFVQEGRLKATQLGSYFDHVVSSQVVGVSKPDHTIFQKALDLSEIKVEESLYIGDSIQSDLIGTNNINMPFVFYNPKKNIVPAHLPTVKWEISDLLQLKELL
ncbi:MAG: YjjG family noncanonical pyrimidine nucleotidase [Candidatus Kariarchaeaceae archaeon]